MARKSKLKVSVWLVILIMLISPVVPPVKAEAPRSLTILFSHDLHSHMESFQKSDAQGSLSESGGWDHLAGVIQREKSLNPDGVLVVDGGDFSMGTLMHSLFVTEALELRLLGAMGYDAATFGNHEFDFDSSGLASMLEQARSSGDRLPTLVCSNLGFKTGQETKSGLNQAMQDFPVRDYTVINKGGVRIGIFGIFGSDAAHDLIWGEDIQLKDPIQEATRVAGILKNREQVDLIVCLSHSGTSDVKSSSEDELLAAKVPDIDVIISGHTHTRLEQPIRVGQTIIASSGSFGNSLGMIKLNCPAGQRPELTDYKLENITPETPSIPAITAKIKEFKQVVDKEFLKDSGLTYDQVLAESSYDLETLDELETNRREAGLGNLIADAFRAAVQKAEGKNGDYLNASVQPLGEIRGTLSAGPIQVDDVFQVLSLGMGPDKTTNYPLLSFYLTGQEIKNCLETQSTVASLKSDYNLQVSGVRFKYNPNRVPFDRIYEIEISSPAGGYEAMQPNKLYRICTSYMTGVMLGKMGSISYGIISVTPKDKNGKPINDLKNVLIDADPHQPGTQELKEWKCLADYLALQPDLDKDGIPDLPAYYRSVAGRYQAIASWNPINLLKNSTYLTWGFLAIFLLAAVMIFIVIRTIHRLVARRRPPVYPV